MALLIATKRDSSDRPNFSNQDPNYLNSIIGIKILNHIDEQEKVFINSLKKLQFSQFENFHLSSENIDFFINLLNNNIIQNIIVRRCEINADCSEELKSFITRYPLLREIEIYQTNNSGVILDVLQNNATIEKLIFSNPMGLFGEVFNKILTNTKTLNELELHDVGFNDTFVKYFFKGIKENTTLKYLTFKGITLTKQSAHFLSMSMMEHKTIKYLSLEDINIESDGIEIFSEMLVENKSIVYLKITNTKIGSNGAKYIANGLTKNSSLKILEMSEAGIEDESIDSICGLITQNKTLSSLNLNENSFSADSIKRIFETLKLTQNINELFLDEVFRNDDICNNEDLDYIISLIKVNFSLTLISIESIIGHSADINFILAKKLNESFCRSSHTNINFERFFEFIDDLDEDEVGEIESQFNENQSYIKTKTNAILKLIEKFVGQLIKYNTEKTPLELSSKEFFILIEKDKHFVEANLKRFSNTPDQDFIKLDQARNKYLLKYKTFSNKIECEDESLALELNSFKSDNNDRGHIDKKSKIEPENFKEFHYFPLLPHELQYEIMSHISILKGNVSSFDIDYESF